MVTELFANNASTTLAVDINAGATTFTVASSTGFPTPTAGTSQFRVICGTELMVVTAVTGTTWTVTRGAESTVAAGHVTGSAVTAIITAGSLGGFAQGAAGGAVDVQVFTASGTWTKPAGSLVQVTLVGGGGGGGSGRRGAAATVRSGGGGGGPAGLSSYTYRASELPATVAVTIPASVGGGASVTTDDTNGAAGTAGGTGTFGVYLRAAGGGGGGGGTATGATGGAAGGIGTDIGTSGTSGGASGGTGLTTDVMTSRAPTGGGSGGGVSTGNEIGRAHV